MRYIVLEILTRETCRDADDYDVASRTRWQELQALMSDAQAPFYRRVSDVDTLEGEARYEATGMAFTLLLGLEGAADAKAVGTLPDVTKSVLAKLLQQKFGWELTSKRIVPGKISELEPKEQQKCTT